MRVTHNSLRIEFLFELEFKNGDFGGGRKTREGGEKPSGQGREPTDTTNSMRDVVGGEHVGLCE